MAVWNQLKEKGIVCGLYQVLRVSLSKAFTRIICGVYSICLLILFLRVEVNILGRYLYLDSSIPSDTTTEEVVLLVS